MRGLGGRLNLEGLNGVSLEFCGSSLSVGSNGLRLGLSSVKDGYWSSSSFPKNVYFNESL
jgi:hypothetical protein